MLQETIEPARVDAFEAVLARCALRPGDTVAVLSESQSRPVLPHLARLAAARLGCQAFGIAVPTLFDAAAPPVRSTGASTALQQIAPVIAGSTLVVDCTVEGLMHAPELPAILRGARGKGRPMTDVVVPDPGSSPGQALIRDPCIDGRDPAGMDCGSGPQ